MAAGAVCVVNPLLITQLLNAYEDALAPTFDLLDWSDPARRRWVHSPSYLRHAVVDLFTHRAELPRAPSSAATLAAELQGALDRMWAGIERASTECKAVAAALGLPVGQLYDAMREAARPGSSAPHPLMAAARAEVARVTGLRDMTSIAFAAAMRGPAGEAAMHRAGILAPAMSSIAVYRMHYEVEGTAPAARG